MDPFNPGAPAGVSGTVKMRIAASETTSEVRRVACHLFGGNHLTVDRSVLTLA